MWLNGLKGIGQYTGDSDDTVRKYLADGMRHVRIGTRIKAKTEWVDAYFGQHEVKDDLEEVVANVVKGLR